MSDNWLIVIPEDPLFMPPEANREAAFKLLCALRPDAQDPELAISETPEFVYCGSNFDSVFCPFCHLDLTESWGDLMNDWSDGDRRVLDIETPCCGRSTTLNNLDYIGPQGFACVRLELMNPGPDLEPEERQQLEAALGTPVRIIWRHL